MSRSCPWLDNFLFCILKYKADSPHTLLLLPTRTLFPKSFLQNQLSCTYMDTEMDFSKIMP